MESHPIHPHALLHQQDGSTGLSATATLTAAISQDIENENQKERRTEKMTILFEKFSAGGESTCAGTALCA
eukprot:4042856-Ditylum_brightwellii.AAC.1